jgi:3-oxoacyl-[acyl-carrier protein] reductase
LVTGSSRGIGRGIAEKLGKEGWDVAIHYSVREDEARSLETILGDRAGGVYGADLSHPGASAALFDAVLADGPIHALVNNAGIYLPQSFLDCSDEDFEENWVKTFTVNWEAPLRLSRLAAKHFVTHGGGKIVNISSRAGTRGESGAAQYAATKGALSNLTRSLAIELAPKNIGVFGVAPGWVETAMGREGMADRAQAILATIPLGRLASVADCAAVTNFLLSPDAAYLSGVVIDVNGASYLH